MSKQSKRRRKAKQSAVLQLVADRAAADAVALKAAAESNGILQLVADVEIQAAVESGKAPRVSIVAYGGGAMQISGFGETAIDLAGLDLPAQVPLLADHDDSLRGIVGHGEPQVQGGQLLVNGFLATAGEAALQMAELAKGGLIFQASVGVIPLEREHVRAGNTITVNDQTIKAGEQGLMLVRAGNLKEISILALGADNQTSVTIAASQQKRNSNMSTSNNTPNLIPDELKATWDQPGLTDIDRINLRANGVKLHDTNLQQEAQSLLIQAAGKKVPFADYDNALLRIENRDLHLQRIKAECPKAPAVHGSNSDMNMNSEVIEAAFFRTAGLPDIEKQYKPEVLEASDRFRGLGIQELLLQGATQGGYSGRMHVGKANLRQVLQAAFSTHTVTTMLTQLGHKSLLAGYDVVPQKWREVAVTETVSDFKQMTAFRLTANLEYDEVGPGGEITHGTLGQESYTKQAKTFAKMLTMTRTDIINDDLGAFNDIRNRLGMGCALKVNKEFWTVWLAAADAGTFWTGARANLVTSSGFGATGIANAVKAFRTIAGSDGGLMDLEPDRVLVPPELEATALEFYTSREVRNTTASTKAGTNNIYNARFKPVVVPQLSNSNFTGNSTTNWWMLPDPAILASASICFLDGAETPVIESADADFDTLGIQFRGYHDFGVQMREWRATTEAQA